MLPGRSAPASAACVGVLVAPSMRRHPSPAARPMNTAGTKGTATPTPATGRGGYLSGIKAAAASVAAVSTFAIASKALARAAPPDQSPIDLDLLASPSSRTTAPLPGKTAPLTPRLSSPSSSFAKIATSTRSNSSSALDQTSSAARSTRQEEQPWAIRRKTLRAALQPTPTSAAPFFEAIGCKEGAIGIIRLPRNAAALIYPASSGSSRSPRPLSSSNCDFFICARDDQSRTEWQVALQLQLEGASCSDALSAHSDNTRALHAVRELQEVVHARDILTQDLAACEKELLELKTAAAAAHQREEAALASNATLTQRVAKLECEVRLSENQQHEMRGRLAQVAVTADAEHGRLAAAECALREQNTAQLKRIAILEERVEASQRLQAERDRALEQLSAAEAQLQALQQEKREAVRELHSRIEKCKSLERQLSMAKEASAANEKEMFSSRAAAARALDEAAACRLKCNELDGASWSSKDKLLKAQEALVSLRKRADAAEQSAERYERQLDETKQKEKQTRAQVALLEKENRELKMDVQSLAAEKQVMRLELLQSSLENDKVRLGASSFACTPQLPAPAPLLSGCFSALMPPQVSAMRATIKSLEQDKAALIARERRSRTGSASGDR